MQRQATAYQLQDLSCLKCKQVKADNMNSYCECSGHFQCTQTKREDFHAQIRKLQTIADFHEFEWLAEVAGNHAADFEDQPEALF